MFDALNDAKAWKLINKSTGREAMHYKCAGCGELFPLKEVVVDHIEPIVPTDREWTWDDIIARALVEKEGFQVLCKPCHQQGKSNIENENRRSFKKLIKEYPREYQSWSNMNCRCFNESSESYNRYGGRGISVQTSWKRDGTPKPFESFLNEMGTRPENTTLDRVDYDKDYSLSNCRWATPTEQSRNTSSNNWISYGNDFMILEEWGEKTGIKPNTILTRLRRGWSIGQALGYEDKEKPIYSGRLTQEDLALIKDLKSEGKTLSEISKEVNLDGSQISRICSKFDWK